MLASIQALIFGSLNEIEIMRGWNKEREQNRPFILFPDVILLTEIYQVRDRLCSEELKGIDDIDLPMCQRPR